MFARFVMTTAIAALPVFALAGPQYSASEIEKHFSQSAACPEGGSACITKPVKTRAVCLGTAQSCAQQEAEVQAAAPAPAAFDLLITFELGSDRLSDQAKQNLAEFAKAMQSGSLADATFNVDGHTDARGTEDFNLGLSQRRAQSVVEYLESLGVPRDRLAPAGHGEAQPRVADPFAAINRRVEATIRTR